MIQKSPRLFPSVVLAAILFQSVLATAQPVPPATSPATQPATQATGRGRGGTPIDPALPTLWIIGDSTVQNGTRGWGTQIATLFDTTKINVQNKAIGGTSSRTFQTQGAWARIVPLIKQGDFVMMQFGHNDNTAPAEPSRARGTLVGIGEEVLDIDNPITKQKETVHTFGWYMRKYINDAKAKGATPIMCSLIPRNIWKGNQLDHQPVNDSYAVWSEQVAKAEKITFIPLNAIVSAKYEALGPEKVAADYFTAADHTHPTTAGAILNARCVIEGLKLTPDSQLIAYLSPAGAAIPAATASTQPAPLGPATGPASSFLGAGGSGDRIVFVLDATGSMMAEFDNLRVQTRAAVENLVPPQSLNVVFIKQHAPPPPAPDLLLATPENKRLILEYVEKFAPSGPTDPIPALTQAFAMKPNLIYLLCDPSDFPDQKAVMDLIHKNNPDNKIKINCIGFEVHDDASKKYLDGIAKETGGTHKEVTSKDLLKNP